LGTAQESRAILSKRVYQRVIPTFLVSVLAGILMVMYFFVPSKIDPLTPEITQWGSICTSASFIFGYVSVPVLHIRRLIARKASRKLLFGSAICLISFFTLLGIIYLSPGGKTGYLYSKWVFYLISFVYLGMQVDWAWHPYTSFRVMRITSVESGLFVVSWILSVLSQLPVWTYLVPPVAVIGDWIGRIPTTAAMRAGLACSGVSSVVLFVRAIPGREPGLIEVEAI
jgi:hypothetical protein